ncbi:MAG: transcription-repair coupling factor [Dehalococcoidia bacterium]|nr:transcription-repair coupling factor [Dehalococcoidia bacterium]
MGLSGLFSFIQESPEFARLAASLDSIEKGDGAVVLDAALPAFVASLRHSTGSPILFITTTPERARKLTEQLRAWCPADCQAYLFPELDVLPYERLSCDQATAWERLRVLSMLANESAPIVVASAAALASRTLAKPGFLSLVHTLKAGSKIDLKRTLSRWQAMGYESEQQVEVPGTFSQRGGILDVYSPASPCPVRIELFGDEVESMRAFDAETQRSCDPILEVTIVPARELLIPGSHDPGLQAQVNEDVEKLRHALRQNGALSGEVRDRLEEELSRLSEGTSFTGADFYAPLLNNGSVLDHFSTSAVVVQDNPGAIALSFMELERQCEQLLQDKVKEGELPHGFPSPYFSATEMSDRLIARTRALQLWPWERHGENAVVMPFAPAVSFGGNLDRMIEEATRARAERRRLVLVSRQASRLSELLEEKNIHAAPHDSIEQPPEPGDVVLVQGAISQGWSLKPVSEQTPVLTVLGDGEILGTSKEQRLARNRPVRHQLLRSETNPGDYVVHIDHGIALFSGMTTMKREGVDREYLVLEYADGDRIYVPVESMDRVDRYMGAGGAPPTLSRLKSGDWQRAKERVRKSVADIALELLDLYAWREVSKGISFPQDPSWMQELEKSFPYIETPDQLKAVEAVKRDMEKGRPMDRVVCGDVGYGKTEVALRAAFKAALGGKQVAILVPTTILAQQHYVTFTERLKPFPVRVGLLSRFCSEKEQQETTKGLAEGSVDICIGTHRLLQKDVIFKDLGLVIIDEEQRFGVVHKEKLKQVRREVDVLTLSATPIPRTMHMALAGVRDISLVETPPEERLPIKTFVGEWDNKTVREAILRELKRNGQILFVHNRVQTIYGLAAEIRTLVPEARVCVGHGQMPEDDLEQVMADFVMGKFDVLVCTTIIESGLDMPRANTLLVKDSERLGLTQLYQLRGRVGRGSVRAYAYFLYRPGKNLTHQAEERLSTISQASELGAGFHIAMKDLEIRGAGNLLGSEQSGHIAAIGYDLYCRMLEEAVEALKKTRTGPERDGKTVPALPGPAFTVDLPISGHLSQEYVPDLATRLAVYRKLASATDEAEIGEVEADLTDRFGHMHLAARDLLFAAKIRLMAAKACVQSLCTEDHHIVLRVGETKQTRLQLMAAVYKDGVQVKGNQIRFDLVRLGDRWREKLPEVLAKLGR